MTFELCLGFVVMILALLLHLGATILLIRIVRLFDSMIETSPHMTVSTTLLLTNFIFFVAQVIGVGMWGCLFISLDIALSFSEAFYAAFVMHTTLGIGPIKPEIGTRLLAPLAAMSGIMTIGWSSAVLIYVVQTSLPHLARNR